MNFFHKMFEKNMTRSDAPVYVGDTVPLPTQATFIQFAKDKRPLITQLALNEIQEQMPNMEKSKGWLQISGLGNPQVIHDICQALGLHSLIIEDILNTEQLSKIELFKDCTLVITRIPNMSDSKSTITFEQISFILKKDLLITFQESHISLSTPVIKYLNHFTTKLFKLDSGHLLYVLLDMIIDEHLHIVDQKGIILESLEGDIIQKHEDIQSDTLYLLKRDMLHMRKNIMGLRNIVSMLLHEHDSILPQLPLIYLRDLQDHVLRILETIEVHRELSKNILDIYISAVNTKINETMKILAVFAAIFIPLTFITGFYGMNFASIPELHWKYGYFFAVGLMLCVSGGLLYYFRKKKWI